MRRQPDRRTVVAWLYVVAVHEAYRLSTSEHRDAHLEDLDIHHGWDTLTRDRHALEDHLAALDALRALADLPEAQRRDLTLFVAGFSYREIADMTGGWTYTNVNKHLGQGARPHPASDVHDPDRTHRRALGTDQRARR